MKRLLIIAVLFLSGCSTIDKIKEVWPRAHDPVMVSAYIDLDIYLDEINCKSPNSIDFAKERAIWLNKYAEFRGDPQRVSTKAIVDNLDKAQTSTLTACDRWVSLSKIRMKTIKEAWSDR